MLDIKVDTRWNTVDEQFWTPYLPWGLRKGRYRIIRVWPGSGYYGQVIDMRFSGMVESGFLDAAKDSPSSMALPRDSNSVILGLFLDETLHASVTLNTPTAAYPGLAMELEKGVHVDHPYFRHTAALEFSKLVSSEQARRSPVSLQILYVAVLLARHLGKGHFWQVSRDIPSDISWRQRFGFDYSIGCRFADKSLNGMPSQVGYACLDSILDYPKLHWMVRRVYRAALRVELAGPA